MAFSGAGQQASSTSVFVAASDTTSDEIAGRSYPAECHQKNQSPSSLSIHSRFPGALPRYLPHRQQMREKQETEAKFFLLKSNVAWLTT